MSDENKVEETSVEERNAIAAAKQKERLEKETKLQDKGPFAGLTKRNEDYVYRLNSILKDSKINDEKRNTVISEIVAELRTEQHKGVTATKLYGPVSTKATDIIMGPQKKAAEPTSSFWLTALDNGLMMLLIFAGMYGVMGLMSKTSTQAETTGAGGLLTLLITSILGGIGAALFYKKYGPNVKKEDKPAFWVTLLVFVAFIAVWIFAYMLVALIPGPLNALLPAPVYLVIALIAFAVRIYVKRRYNINRTMF
ncbi:DUF1129 family protein [Dellaglioa sp. P0083]|uniref:DUF1129 family protein n=1 Tax=Dellaglioa kimchii TaxID=3344667 RepID=UPI0038D477C3